MRFSDSGVVLVRSPEGERTVAALGGEPFRADLFDAGTRARRIVENPCRDQKDEKHLLCDLGALRGGVKRHFSHLLFIRFNSMQNRKEMP